MRYPTITIGSFLLADAAGRKCKCSIEPAGLFISTVARSVVFSATGKPFEQKVETDFAGTSFVIKAAFMPLGLLHSIISEVNTNDASDADTRVQVTDAVQDFDVMAIPAGSDWYTHERYSGDAPAIIVENVVFRFISTGPGE